MVQLPYKSEQSLQIAERVFKTSIPGLYFLNQNKHGDERGFFSEVAIIDDLNTILEHPFQSRQVNLALSQTHVARGFHIENWNKLTTIVQGTAFCCIADVRPESPTYKKVETFILGSSPEALTGCLYISKGLGNSYCVLEGPVQYLYLVDALYRDRDAQNDQSISLFDPDLEVSWPIPKDQMIISTRDQNAKTLNDVIRK
jgi:dTDP-4-dehydrorhamnose 3,5-epimerase